MGPRELHALQTAQPLTMFTDYALAAMGVLFALRLHFRRVNGATLGLAARLWSGAFAAAAVAATLGGSFHGFGMIAGAAVRAVLWKGTVYAVGLAGFFMLVAAIISVSPATLRRVLIALAVLKFVVYGIWMATHDSFRYVVYDYGSAMLIVLLLYTYAGLTRRDPSAGWIGAGVLLSFAGAGVQRTAWPEYAQFNHNDLYHFVQIAALYLFYRGARLVRDR